MIIPRIPLREFSSQYLVGNALATAAVVVGGVLVSHATSSLAVIALSANLAET